MFYGHLTAIFSTKWRQVDCSTDIIFIEQPEPLRHSMKQVLSEPLRCVGSGIASSGSHCYRKGHFCDQFFTKFHDTDCVYDREPERSRVTS